MKILYENTVTPNPGVTDMLNTVMQKKWELVSDITSVISTLEAEGYGAMCPVFEQILVDENNHIGEIQTCIEMTTPAATQIEIGSTDAIALIDNNNVTPQVIGVQDIMAQQKPQEDIPVKIRIVQQ